MVGSSETLRAVSGQNLQAVLLCGMADTDQITPALTAEEWARWQRHDDDGRRGMLVGERDAAKVAALGNAALPDDDPRKITRAHIEALMECVKFTGGPEADKAEELAKILTALLPP
jgi:hypothetical protein